MLEQIIGSGNGLSIVLIIAIVIAFVVAFKIMQMVFETVIVSLLSGAFYLSMRYLQGGAVSINDLLLFSFLGASLYMLYSVLGTAYSIAATVLPLPYNIVKTLSKPFEVLWERYWERQKRKSYVSRDGEKKEEKSTKEVILGKDNDQDDDKED